jgi:membrane glycosyltransferase
MTDWNLDLCTGRAWWRRSLLFCLVGTTTLAGGFLMGRVLGIEDGNPVDIALLAAFTIGFCWIAISFWAAVFGFLLALFGLHPITLSRRAPSSGRPPALTRRTAVLMPIYNEDPQQVFGRVVATYRSLLATGEIGAFDFFVLSDTTDAGIAHNELLVWMSVRQSLGAEQRLFYRRRPLNVARKAGNIADWLDMYGRRYDHMLVLDADSVMAGDTIVRLAALMEASPRTGIIQTIAIPVGRETLFARCLQFSTRLYGPLLAAGHSFWQMGEANYYGHNAIIRTSAFAAHCRLPTLPGEAPLGGEILSHDFVEAAFIRRGGWHVWLLPELGGSFEEIPSNLPDYATRDRRWVQGNLQHGRLITSPGLHAMSRLHLGMGILGYASSMLWLLFLVLSGAAMIGQELAVPVYFGPGRSLFPIWPAYRTLEVHSLLALTAVLLFVPKLLSIILTVFSSAARQFGGRLALLASAVLEQVFSMLLAPVMMLLHSEFIVRILSGRAVGWPAQSREDRGVPWTMALRRHLWHSLIGLAGATILGLYAPSYLPWVAPVIAGLLLAAPLTVLSSRRTAGLAAHYLNLFLTPEENDVPVELATLQPARKRRFSLLACAQGLSSARLRLRRALGLASAPGMATVALGKGAGELGA